MNNLIKDITPLYNKYKQEKGNLTGSEALKIMWEIGDHLKSYIDDNDVAPHNLYRQIYGKSEGKTNVEQQSYITREFLGRSFRIRNIFASKIEIDQKQKGLIDFTSFREAMPFFDNPVYSLNENEYKKLLELLNSSIKSSVIIDKLDKWKKSINNITNSRSQKLGELENEKDLFVSFYNLIYKSLSLQTHGQALELIGISDLDYLIILSKNISATAQEGVLKYKMKDLQIDVEISNSFILMLIKLLSKEDEKERRRFRRIIPPERMIRLSEMIYTLTSETQYQKNKIK